MAANAKLQAQQLRPPAMLFPRQGPPLGRRHLDPLLTNRASSLAHQALLMQLPFYLCLQLQVPFISKSVGERGGPQVHQTIHTGMRGWNLTN